MQALGVGDAALARVADGRRDAGVGHRDDEVGLDRRLPGEVAAHLEAAVGERAAVEPRVGAREVDELEDAHRRARPGQLDALAAQLPSPSTMTISPGSISRTNSAPMMSRAQVSLAITALPSKSPRQSGRTP